MKTHDHSIKLNTLISKRYRVQSVLGEGGFSITYKAWDEVLEIPVVIKEYLPAELGVRDHDSIRVLARTQREDDFKSGLESFVDEARRLAKFDHPNIVRVSNFVECNGTAYIVMKYEQGQTLSQWLKTRSQACTEQNVLEFILPLLEGLKTLHSQGMLHRDIKPANIFLREQGAPLFIDLGSARQALSGQSKSLSAIVSQGYAPPEQYSNRGRQGPYTDFYALGAVMYRMVSGKDPVESTDRAHEVYQGEEDPLPSALKFHSKDLSKTFLTLIDQLLSIRTKDRPQTVAQVKAVLDQNEQNRIEKEGSLENEEYTSKRTRVVSKGEQFGSSPPKTKKVKFWILVTLVLIVTGGGALYWLQHEHARFGPNMISELVQPGRQIQHDQLEILAQAESTSTAFSELEQALERFKTGISGDTTLQDDLKKLNQLNQIVQFFPIEDLVTEQEVTDVIIYQYWFFILLEAQIGPKRCVDLRKEIGEGAANSQLIAPVKYIADVIDVLCAKAQPLIESVEAANNRLRYISGEVFQDRLKAGGVGPEMVVIPMVNVLIGDVEGRSTVSKAQRRVKFLAPFAMGKFEVTFDEYDYFCEQTGRVKPYDQGWGRGRRPVINVNYDDAQAYVDWLSTQTGQNYRIPSETMWEAAARGGMETEFPWGGETPYGRVNIGDDMCVDGRIQGEDRWRYTAAVGSGKAPYGVNRYGLHDVIGNVWEWARGCLGRDGHYGYYDIDENGYYFENESCDVFKVSRGGGWNSCAWLATLPVRGLGSLEGDKVPYVGFRVVRDLL